MAQQVDTTTTVTEYTPARRKRFATNNGYPQNGRQPTARPRGRTLKEGYEEGRYTVQDWQFDGSLRWASTVSEPEAQPHSVLRLIATLIAQGREVKATALRVFGFPALATQAIEQEILARRRDVLGVRSWGRDRSARRVVQGDSRAATMAVGSA